MLKFKYILFVVLSAAMIYSCTKSELSTRSDSEFTDSSLFNHNKASILDTVICNQDGPFINTWDWNNPSGFSSCRYLYVWEELLGGGHLYIDVWNKPANEDARTIGYPPDFGLQPCLSITDLRACSMLEENKTYIVHHIINPYTGSNDPPSPADVGGDLLGTYTMPKKCQCN